MSDGCHSSKVLKHSGEEEVRKEVFLKEVTLDLNLEK